jgi:uncharacterized cofD-like protein
MMPLSSGRHASTDRPELTPVRATLRVAALGGGTGLPNVLRGLRMLLYGGATRRDDPAPADRLVAIVPTTDDGGSSGRLRRDFGMIPPGDIRNCLAALAEDQALLTELFQYRFAAGDGLQGHALGNLVLAALAEVTGDVTRAIDVAARVVGARGRVLPATVDSVTLSAELVDGRVVQGESAVVSAGSAIRRLSLVPAEPRCVAAAVEAVRRAEVIVAGPGSLYTSILPPLLMPELTAAIRETDASRVFVLNLMTEPGETEDYDGPRHLETLMDHLGFQPFDHVIFNTGPVPEHLEADYATRGSVPIRVSNADIDTMRRMGVQPIGAPLACEGPAGRIRHHPGRLAAAITACTRFSARSFPRI